MKWARFSSIDSKSSSNNNADVLGVRYIQKVMQKKLCEIKAPKYEISFYYLEMIISKILLDLSRIIILWGGCTKEQSKVDFRHGLVH